MLKTVIETATYTEFNFYPLIDEKSETVFNFILF